MRRFLLSLLVIAGLSAPAHAQQIGGAATLTATSTSSEVALPALTSSYPALLISPAPGTTTETFYAFGKNSSVTATTSSPALPPGGMCFSNVGPNTNLAAITASGSATLRLTQLSQCPQLYGNGGGGPVLQAVYDKSNATIAAQYCQITVTTTAASLSSLLSGASCAAIPATALSAYLTPEASAQIAIRYRADGTAPTAAVGQPIAGYQSWPMASLLTLNAALLISATGASVTVDVEIRG